MARRPSASATFAPRSSCRSATTTVAPAAASAWAIPSPRPWAPPVTSALRPVRSRSVMRSSFGAAGGGRHHTWPRVLTAVKTFLTIVKKIWTAVKIRWRRRRMPTRATRPSARRGAGRAPAGQVRRAPQPARRVGPARRSASSATPAPACARSPSNSEFSHGVVHYYFADKIELIIYCVRYYKAQLRDAATTTSSRRRPPPRSWLDGVRRQAGRDDQRRGADAPPLVRPAHPEHVRGPAPRGGAR